MELTASQAMLLIEAREVLRGRGVDVDQMSDGEVLAYIFDASQTANAAIQKIIPFLEALKQSKRAEENKGDFSPN